MSRDFANTKKDIPRQKPRQYLWVFTFVIVAVFALFLGYLIKLDPQAESLALAQEKNPTKTGADALVDRLADTKVMENFLDKNKNEEQRFSFYRLLPSFNIEKNIKEALPQTSEERRSYVQEPTDILSYSIQTDSFKSPSDADKRKAELLLMGFDVKVQKVDLASNGRWHRVSVGPFKDSRELSRAQRTLAELNIFGTVRELRR